MSLKNEFRSTAELLAAVEDSRILREKLLGDKYRPGYHFACPSDNGIPGDPNGAFYANGRYHLMYLYQSRTDGFRWGHISSADLLHWRHHPDALIPDELDGGIFSGGAYVEGETVYLCYWALPTEKSNGGIRIAYSDDRENHYEKWIKCPEYAVTGTAFGHTEDTDENGEKYFRGSSDPSNIWKKGGKYYIEAGALTVLDMFRNNPDAPKKYLGDWTDLYSTDDLMKPDWKYEHRFYQRDTSNRWTDESEDDMCPSFLPLPDENGNPSGKYIQIFIAHNKGTQYYIGEYDADKDLFYPEKHGRMSWCDNTYFAPEALMSPDGRQILWAWLLDNMDGELERFGWSGVYALPREVWLRSDGELGIRPIRELENLEYNKQYGPENIAKSDKKSCRISFKAKVSGGKAGLKLFSSADGEKYASVYYDGEIGALVFDESKSGRINHPARVNTPWYDPERKIFASAEFAPFRLNDGEELDFTCYIDGPVVDVFVNGRQAITRRVCVPNPDERLSPKLICENAEIISASSADMMPTNAY
ncbi:MAG: glycoside hydrolase family 32 protein [Eubacteriales bacterium]